MAMTEIERFEAKLEASRERAKPDTPATVLNVGGLSEQALRELAAAKENG